MNQKQRERLLQTLDCTLRHMSALLFLYPQRSKLFNNALNLEQNMNQNCFYPSVPHIKTLACKNYASLKISLQCVVTHPIGNLRGTITLRIVSQNSNSLTLQGFLEGQIRRKANVSSFGESMTCLECFLSIQT